GALGFYRRSGRVFEDPREQLLDDFAHRLVMGLAIGAERVVGRATHRDRTTGLLGRHRSLRRERIRPESDPLGSRRQARNRLLKMASILDRLAGRIYLLAAACMPSSCMRNV